MALDCFACLFGGCEVDAFCVRKLIHHEILDQFQSIKCTAWCSNRIHLHLCRVKILRKKNILVDFHYISMHIFALCLVFWCFTRRLNGINRVSFAGVQCSMQTIKVVLMSGVARVSSANRNSFVLFSSATTQLSIGVSFWLFFGTIKSTPMTVLANMWLERGNGHIFPTFCAPNIVCVNQITEKTWSSHFFNYIRKFDGNRYIYIIFAANKINGNSKRNGACSVVDWFARMNFATEQFDFCCESK